MPAALAPDPLVALADRCVQCGLCLPHCPTYALDCSEAESPRGRIAYARALATGLLAPTATGDLHLDHCLGCRRCEPVCPAGVQYGRLLVEARTRQRRRRRPPLRQRAAEWLAARPGPLAVALAAYRLAYPLLPAALRPLPRPPKRIRAPAAPVPGAPETVAVFRGCVARRYDAPTHAALGRLCAAAGIATIAPAAQACCGALHAHAGDSATAALLARRNRVAFAGCATVLSSASGCHEALARALDDGQVRDAFHFLHAHADALRFRPASGRVALHLPCTQRSLTKSAPALRALLARVPGLDLVELPDTGCCGAAGSHMLTAPGRATRLRAPLLAALAASRATTLLSANIGCRLHLASAAAVPVRHPLDFLAEHVDAPSQEPARPCADFS